VTPSSNRDLLDDEVRPTIDRYDRGSTGDVHDRVKLFKLISGRGRQRVRKPPRRPTVRVASR
jgi:aromatic ring hydroxylase